MNIGQTLYQGPKASQQLNLAPQLLNWLQLLQAPVMELNAMVRHELETNPALEMELDSEAGREAGDLPETAADAGDGLGSDDGMKLDDSTLNARLESLQEIDQEWRDDYQASRKSGNDRAEEDEKHQYLMDSITQDDTLYNHLVKQLGPAGFTAQEARLAEVIIGSLDRRGYLAESLVALAEAAGAKLDEMQLALRRVQQLHPAGVAARDLRECLLLQLEEQGADTLACAMVRDGFDLLADRKLGELARRLGVTEDEVRDGLAEIRALDPAPGLTLNPEPVAVITPDAAIRRQGDDLVIDIHDDYASRVSISPSCRQLLEQKSMSSQDLSYLRQKIRNGQFLISGLQQRRETLLRVTEQIVRVQREFLAEKEGELVPLTMNKVAAIIGVHETTVSRAIANKYVATPRGVMAMKTFFKTGYRCADGSSLTPDKVKDLISRMITEESPAQPVTDDDISKQLKERGLNVARRTVAKYREELGVASSKDRLQLKARRGGTVAARAPAMAVA